MRAPRSIVDRLFRDLHGALPHDKIVLRRAKQQRALLCRKLVFVRSGASQPRRRMRQPSTSRRNHKRRRPVAVHSGSTCALERGGWSWVQALERCRCCKTNRATAVWYEPDSDCLKSLSLNVSEFEHHSMPITPQITESISGSEAENPEDHYRATTLPTAPLPSHQRHCCGISTAFSCVI
jgi:hypothetical protein